MPLTVVDRVVALHEVPLFAGVPGRTLAAVAACAEEVPVSAGDAVIVEGVVEDHLFVVVRGRLRASHDGGVLRDLGPGSTVGELAALVPEPRSATVTALEEGLLLRIDRLVLDELLTDHPELARGVIRTLVAMVRGNGTPPAGDDG